MKIMFFGGDMRQRMLRGLFEAAGHGTAAWGLDGLGVPSDDPECVGGADLAVLPYPAAEGDCIRAPFALRKMPLSEFFGLSTKAAVLAGAPPEIMKKAAKEKEIRLFDYATEELLRKNAYLTAEGALGTAVERLPCRIRGTEMLVAGCGRIGRELAVLLGKLGAEVSVSALRPESLEWAAKNGFSALRTDGMGDALGRFRMVFNTVPRRVFSRRELSALRPDCVLAELASAPGGFDASAAEKLGLEIVSAPGLPGKTSPETATEIIYEEIEKLLATEGIGFDA
ncbi:MAG: dipicolinate synthase subunit DpsA [Eubacteriales bacterium]